MGFAGIGGLYSLRGGNPGEDVRCEACGDSRRKNVTRDVSSIAYWWFVWLKAALRFLIANLMGHPAFSGCRRFIRIVGVEFSEVFILDFSLVFLATPSLDDSKDRDRDALARGDILPLSRILDVVKSEAGGRVINV